MYSIEIKGRVFKFLLSLQNSKEILSKIEKLKYFKSNRKIKLDIKKMQNQKKSREIYRMRIGDIRIIFEIFKDKNLVYIKEANFRGKVYK